MGRSASRGWLDRILGVLGLDFDLAFDLEPDRFNRITDDLFLGGRPEPEHLRMLRDAGITHVYSCLDADVQPRVAFLAEHVQTGFLAMRDGMHEDLAAGFADFFMFVDQAGPDARVLVHCERGVSRSATLAIALHMHRTGLGFFDAFSAVRQRRPEVLPNIGFASQLQRFEHADPSSSRASLRGDPPGSSLGRYLHEVCRAPVEREILEQALARHDFDALGALGSIFGPELPRVIQGVRL